MVRILVLVALLALVSAVLPSPALAGSKPVSYVSLDAATGKVLDSRNADTIRPPASVIKLMLMYMVAEGIEQGKWSLDTPVTVTRHAQKMGGTQVFLAEGQVWPLHKLMDAVAVASANDAAMAVAEGLWGSEEAYLIAINERAPELGMNDSHFNSVHGLPPSWGEEPDRTSARDIATLAKYCVRYEQILNWTCQKRITFSKDFAPYLNTNSLLRDVKGCDGLKTGFISRSGFCIAATAQRGEGRIIAVVLGAPSKRERTRLTKKLLEDGFKTLSEQRQAQLRLGLGEFAHRPSPRI